MAELAEGIEDIPNDFLFCRLNHLFDFQTDYDIIRSRGKIESWRRQWKCLRCSAEKHELIDGTGRVVRSKIDYPGKYLLKKGSGRLTHAQVRLEQMAR